MKGINVVVEAVFRSNKQIRGVIAELEKKGFTWNSDWGLVTSSSARDRVWIAGFASTSVWPDLESVKDVIRVWDSSAFKVFGP